MYAIVRISGRQYFAEVGSQLVTEKLPLEIGETVQFDEVLFIGDGEKSIVGQPLVEGSSVTAEVTDQFKGKKIIVFKFKPKQRYRRKKGHRQQYTRLMVQSIAGGGGSAKKSRSKKTVAEEATPEEA